MTSNGPPESAGTTSHSDQETSSEGRPSPGSRPLLSRAFAHVDGFKPRPSASVGVLIACVGLVAATLTWTESPPFVPTVTPAGSTIGAAFATVAVLGFLLRRTEALPPWPGAFIAGGASGGLVITAFARFFAPAINGGPDPVVGPGIPLAIFTGTLGIGFAIADATDVPISGLLERARRTVVGVSLIVAVFLTTALFRAPLARLELGVKAGIVAGVVLTDVIFIAAALLFLIGTGRGLSFIDVKTPTLKDVAYTVVGFVTLFLTLIGLNLTRTALGLPATTNVITEAARNGYPNTLLLLVPLTILVVAPAEELLNRNVIQKYLYGTFSRPAAVVVGSLVFASAHVFSYSGDNIAGTTVSLISVFVLALILGAIYERTENILVPIAVHGAFNAVQFLLLYVVIVYLDIPQ